MKIEKFEDIISWQKAKELTIKIYNIFKETKDFGFKNQIERASVSIMNNIAEGFDRQTKKEFIHFLYIAKASNAEVRSMLNLAKDLDKINEKDFLYLYNLSEEISRLLYGFIKSLQKSI